MKNPVPLRIHILSDRWLSWCRPLRQARRWSAESLLQAGVRRMPGAARFGLAACGAVQVGELRVPDGAEPEELANAAAVGEHFAAVRKCPPPTVEQLAASLAACGVQCVDRQGARVITKAGSPEIVATPASGGIRLEVRLAQWEADLAADCRRALATYLCLAHTSLCGVRCRLEPHAALAGVHVATAWLDADLSDGLTAVAHAQAVLGRQVAALLRPEVAGEYLRILAREPDRGRRAVSQPSPSLSQESFHVRHCNIGF